MLQDFDARTVQPQQPSGNAHPPGMFDYQITNTWLQPSNNNEHLMLLLEFTTPAGRHVERFIVAGNSPKAIEIANKQISAICHTVGVFRLTYPKDQSGNPIMEQGARELRGARGKFELAPQKDKENKETGYVEVKKYFDMNGNEPGKQGPQPQPQQAGNSNWGGGANTTQAQPGNAQPSAPMTQQPNGNWGQQPQQQQANPNPPAQAQGWQPPQNQQPSGQPQTPPWGQR